MHCELFMSWLVGLVTALNDWTNVIFLKFFARWRSLCPLDYLLVFSKFCIPALAPQNFYFYLNSPAFHVWGWTDVKIMKSTWIYYHLSNKRVAEHSIGSKSLNLRKKAGCKIQWLERNYSHFSIILPLDFLEMLNRCRNYSLFHISALLWCDVIKFLNDKPEKWKSFAWYHIVGIHKLWFSWKLFDLPSTGLEITIVLSFLENFLEFLKKEEKHCNSENSEDFRKVQRQIYCKIVQVSFKGQVQGWYNCSLFKRLHCCE